MPANFELSKVGNYPNSWATSPSLGMEAVRLRTTLFGVQAGRLGADDNLRDLKVIDTAAYTFGPA